MHRLCLLVLALAATVFAAPAEKKDDSAKVEGFFVIPKEAASFEGRVVEIHLFKYDPLLADAAADLVEKVEFKTFSHTAGKETKQAFVIGAKAKLEPGRSYYVRLYIMEQDKRTHMGRCEHDKDGIGKVLTNGFPRLIHIRVAAIK